MLDKVDKNDIDCTFTKSSFTLKIRNYNGKNLILNVPHLYNEIDDK
jgi:hypothetical protein